MTANNVGSPSKYIFMSMEDLGYVREALNCNMSYNANDAMRILNKNELISRHIITKCEHCPQCENMSMSYQWLTNLVEDYKINSLLVVVVGGSTRLEVEKLKNIEILTNSVKIVYMDEEPGQINLCEVGDNNDNDALKSFSKTSVSIKNKNIF